MRVYADVHDATNHFSLALWTAYESWQADVPNPYYLSLIITKAFEPAAILVQNITATRKREGAGLLVLISR
jgi:hypothetical protein